MADYFQILSGDVYLALITTTQQMLNIVKQVDTSYEYSFHTMHEKGCPLYVTPKGRRGKNMAKMLTEGKSAASWITVGKLNRKQKNNAITCANSNWALMCQLAQNYYKPTDEEIISPKGRCKKCATVFDDISTFTPAPFNEGYWVCPKCGVKGFVKLL